MIINFKIKICGVIVCVFSDELRWALNVGHDNARQFIWNAIFLYILTAVWNVTIENYVD